MLESVGHPNNSSLGILAYDHLLLPCAALNADLIDVEVQDLRDVLGGGQPNEISPMGNDVRERIPMADLLDLETVGCLERPSVAEGDEPPPRGWQEVALNHTCQCFFAISSHVEGL